jgi:hypothetical protein
MINRLGKFRENSFEGQASNILISSPTPLACKYFQIFMDFLAGQECVGHFLAESSLLIVEIL